jgi:hypothetical protein
VHVSGPYLLYLLVPGPYLLVFGPYLLVPGPNPLDSGLYLLVTGPCLWSLSPGLFSLSPGLWSLFPGPDIVDHISLVSDPYLLPPASFTPLHHTPLLHVLYTWIITSLFSCLFVCVYFLPFTAFI